MVVRCTRKDTSRRGLRTVNRGSRGTAQPMLADLCRYPVRITLEMRRARASPRLPYRGPWSCPIVRLQTGYMPGEWLAGLSGLRIPKPGSASPGRTGWARLAHWLEWQHPRPSVAWRDRLEPLAHPPPRTLPESHTQGPLARSPPHARRQEAVPRLPSAGGGGPSNKKCHDGTVPAAAHWQPVGEIAAQGRYAASMGRPGPAVPVAPLRQPASVGP